MTDESKTTADFVAVEVSKARAAIGNIAAEADFCISEIGVLRREDTEIALASEVLRLRAALLAVARVSPKPGGAGQIARDALRIGI